MANYYVKSGAAGAADGSSWANAFTTLVAAMAGKAAGDVFWVSNNHAETQASAMTLTFPGTAASPNQILCVNDSAEPPTALATTATISTTGANSFAGFGGYAYIYGIQFQAGSAGNAANIPMSAVAAHGLVFDSCVLKLNNTSASSLLVFGGQVVAGNDQRIELINTTLNFGAAGQSMRLRGRNIWNNVTLAGTAPTVLMTAEPTTPHTLLADGCDLSLITGTLFTVSGTECDIRLLNCKLGAAVTITTGSIVGPGTAVVEMINCDSADTNYRYYFQSYEGTINQSTGVIMTGGSSDGVTPFSRQFVSTANSKFWLPLEGPVFTFWNETVGSVTVTVEVVTNNVTLTDAEAWVEVEYQGTSGFPLGLFISDRAANILTTPANQASSSESWPSAPGTPVTQKFSVTFTTTEKGWVMARVMLAKASTTMYADCKILSTSYKQTMEADGSILNDVKLPTIAQVETGVTYGADGTEFTGTLSAGGGGGGPIVGPGAIVGAGGF